MLPWFAEIFGLGLVVKPLRARVRFVPLLWALFLVFFFDFSRRALVISLLALLGLEAANLGLERKDLLFLRRWGVPLSPFNFELVFVQGNVHKALGSDVLALVVLLFSSF